MLTRRELLFGAAAAAPAAKPAWLAPGAPSAPKNQPPHSGGVA